MSGPNGKVIVAAVLIAAVGLVKICQRRLRNRGLELSEVATQVKECVYRALQRIREDARWHPER